MAQPDPTLWQWLSEHLWAPFVGLVAVWWSMLQHRITKVEKRAEDAVTGEEFMGYVARTDKRLDELRDDIGKIFETFRTHDREDRLRHDELVATIHDNHKELLAHLLKQRPR